MKITGFESYDVSEEGVVTNTRTGRVLKQDLSAHKYPRVTLSENSKLKRFFVHRLVASHFIENPLNLPMVNHIDGNKLNNSVGNLEWVTCQENTIHAFAIGLRASGSKHWCAKLDEDLVHQICEEISKGLTRNEIIKQERFQSVNKTQFDDIRRRRSWSRVSSNYRW